MTSAKRQFIHISIMSTGMQDKCRSSLNNLLWLFFTAACIRDMSCFQIDRRVTSKSILPYPSADRFSNPRKPLCMFIYTSCNKYSAKCSGFGSCCRCECRGHTPNFLSSTTGCVNAYSLGTKRGRTIFTYDFGCSRTMYLCVRRENFNRLDDQPLAIKKKRH